MHRISAPANPVSGRFLQIRLRQKLQPDLTDLKKHANLKFLLSVFAFGVTI